MADEAARGEAARILVIKLGALGDFVQALGAFAAIRGHHPGARVTLLTTAPFAGLARATGYFDEVWLDPRPGLLDPPGWLALRRRLKGGRFARIYDLQTSSRSRWYFRLLGPGRRPEWSGHVRGASHRQQGKARDRLHTLDRLAAQLATAGIAQMPPPDLAWAMADLARFALPERFALLVPGGAAHRPRKRWPVQLYAALARELAARGLVPVILGTASERRLGQAICGKELTALDLTGRTSLEEVAGLARRAALAVGNDTGPMRLAAAAGCPSLVLFSDESDPALCAPRGLAVRVLRRADLTTLSLADLLRALPEPREAPHI